MEVRVTTDHNIEGSEALNKYLGEELNTKLNRFSEHVTKIEVHLADENSNKTGPNDKRCIIQATVKGRPALVATNHADTVEEAFSGSLTKLKSSLDSHVERLKEH